MIVRLQPYYSTAGSLATHQVRLMVDGRQVGYCPAQRGPIPILGSLTAEARRAVENACGEYWGDESGAGSVQYLPPLETDDDDE